MGTTTFSGPVVSNNGFVGSGTTTMQDIDVTGSASVTLDLTVSGEATFADDVTISGTTTLGIYSYTGAPSADVAGTAATIYMSNGASGSPVLVFSDGSDWLRCDTLGTASPTNT